MWYAYYNSIGTFTIPWQYSVCACVWEKEEREKESGSGRVRERERESQTDRKGMKDWKIGRYVVNIWVMPDYYILRMCAAV